MKFKQLLKSILLNCIHTYQSRFNERLYWKRRFYCQNHNYGWLRYLYLVLLRRTENNMCADTGLGLNTVEVTDVPYRISIKSSSQVEWHNYRSKCLYRSKCDYLSKRNYCRMQPLRFHSNRR